MSDVLKAITYTLLNFIGMFPIPFPNINYIFIWKLIVILLQDSWQNHTLNLF